MNHVGEGGVPWSSESKQRLETTVKWGVKEWEGESREERKWELMRAKTQGSFLTTGPLPGKLQKLPWSPKIRMASNSSNR